MLVRTLFFKVCILEGRKIIKLAFNLLPQKPDPLG